MGRWLPVVAGAHPPAQAALLIHMVKRYPDTVQRAAI